LLVAVLDFTGTASVTLAPGATVAGSALAAVTVYAACASTENRPSSDAIGTRTDQEMCLRMNLYPW
jgi:hypothetical protein